MIELLHLIESLGSGGAERVLCTNLAHLDPGRFHSSVLTVREEGDHFKPAIESLGVRVDTLGVRTRGELASAIPRLSRLLARRKVALVHTHLWEANVVGRLAGRLVGVPVVSSIHSPDYEPQAWQRSQQGHQSKRRIFRGLDRASARFGCTRMIAVSEYVRLSAHLHLRFPLERIDLVYNPIDPDGVRCPRRERSSLLAELGLPLDSVVLLSVARVTPQKGLLYAIDALPAILQSHPRAYLLSAGSLDHRGWFERLERHCADRGLSERVRFLGPRHDVPDLLNACDLFVFPSLVEGLGLALIEAMAAGRACVAAAVGSTPEILRDGIEGWVVPAADAAALAKAVVRALDDDEQRARRGEAAAQTAADRFDSRRAARRLQEVYERVLARG